MGIDEEESRVEKGVWGGMRESAGLGRDEGESMVQERQGREQGWGGMRESATASKVITTGTHHRH